MTRLRLVCTLACAVCALTTPPDVRADFSAAIANISPETTETTEELPPFPPRLSAFALQGVPGTSYSIDFFVTAEPALVVAVGADIQETSFDPRSGRLTVEVDYDGAAILVDENVELPENSFILFLDPGIERSALAVSARRTRSVRAATARAEDGSCYGPGFDPSLYKGPEDDLGEDPGLAAPSKPTTADTTIGFPSDAPGSFASTNAFYWCVVPPGTGAQATTGLSTLATEGSVGMIDFYYSSPLLSFFATRVGSALSSSNLAVFSDTLQVTGNVTAEDTGVSFETNPAFVEASNDISGDTTGAGKTGTLVRRTIGIGKKEPLSLTPANANLARKKLAFFGFVDDLSFAGAFVDIIRLEKRKSCGVTVQASTGTQVGRVRIGPDGRFDASVPTSTLDPRNSGSASLTARIDGEAARKAREVSLANRNRGNRR